jgi:hypothetical protein
MKEFMGSCDVCVCAKHLRHCLHGFFQPLLILTSPWSLISMDFIMDFSQSNSFDSILVVVDRLVKMVHFIPCNKSIPSKNITKLFFDNVFHYHGFFKDIIFDSGPQFTSKFWKQLFELLGVKVKLSSTFHPQTYRQMKQVNQVLEQYL